MRGPTCSIDIPPIRLASAVLRLLEKLSRQASGAASDRAFSIEREFRDYIDDLEVAARAGFDYGLDVAWGECLGKRAQS